MRRALIAAACLALTMSACADGPSSASGGQDHAAAIRDAIERTLEAGSARVTFDLDIRNGARSGSVDGSAELILGDGPGDGEAHLTLHLPELGQGAPAGTFEVIVERGPVFYLQADALGGFLPVSTPWVKLDPAAMGEGWGPVPGMGSATTAPSDALELLEGVVDVQLEGQETIDGEAATHYLATVDLQAALDRVPADQRSEVDEALEKLRAKAGLDPSEIPIDVWLADGLVKRIGFELSSDATGSGGELSATLTLSDVGGDLQIDPPPAHQVTDLSELAGMWAAAAGGAQAA